MNHLKVWYIHSSIEKLFDSFTRGALLNLPWIKVIFKMSGFIPSLSSLLLLLW